MTRNQVLAQITGPAGGQTVCLGGPGVVPITFQWGGSATGIRLINNAPGLTSVINNAARTITITGSPTSTGFVRVETTEALPGACGILRQNHTITVVTAPQLPDYIRIYDPAAPANPPTVLIPNQTTDPTLGQDGNIYNAQLYSCEQALNTAPAPVTFDACYNDGRIAPLTSSFRWYVAPPSAGTMNA